MRRRLGLAEIPESQPGLRPRLRARAPPPGSRALACPNLSTRSGPPSVRRVCACAPCQRRGRLRETASSRTTGRMRPAPPAPRPPRRSRSARKRPGELRAAPGVRTGRSVRESLTSPGIVFPKPSFVIRWPLSLAPARSLSPPDAKLDSHTCMSLHFHFICFVSLGRSCNVA